MRRVCFYPHLYSNNFALGAAALEGREKLIIWLLALLRLSVLIHEEIAISDVYDNEIIHVHASRCNLIALGIIILVAMRQDNV